ncbi:hypothetical protein OTU49_016379 [Cherax quadricarinatus]|uniref:Uncharacterized protein n=1 Tax=Cherax quadricarinatus TaxID=27406 RepID=A0AAW0Y961_CHEQU|nr:uncharacterized protein LOC128688564 isoform X2 [Cherax quadricarinatus]
MAVLRFKNWPRNFVLLVITLQVLTFGQNLVGAVSREGERLHTVLQELTTVLQSVKDELRVGFQHLVNELQQERIYREEVIHVLRAQIDNNRKALENVLWEVGNVSDHGRCSCHDDQDGGRLQPGGEQEDHDNLARTAPDADTPGCPPPFDYVPPHCLTLLKERTPWESTRSRCHSHVQSLLGSQLGSRQVSGDIVVPHNMEAFKNYVNSMYLGGSPSGWAYVGGSTEGWGGAWAWVDGSLIKELPWLYTQPGVGFGRLAIDSDTNFHVVEKRDLALWVFCQLN